MSEFDFDHPQPDLLAEKGMACDRGCFVCGPDGQRHGHDGTGCCGSTMCDSGRWRLQVQAWLSIEEKFKYALWLFVEQQTQEEWCAAEEAFREELRARAKPVVVNVPPAPNNPSRRRGVKVAQRQTQSARTK